MRGSARSRGATKVPADDDIGVYRGDNSLTYPPALFNPSTLTTTSTSTSTSVSTTPLDILLAALATDDAPALDAVINVSPTLAVDPMFTWDAILRGAVLPVAGAGARSRNRQVQEQGEEGLAATDVEDDGGEGNNVFSHRIAMLALQRGANVNMWCEDTGATLLMDAVQRGLRYV
jgi:hypothetical protein